MRYLDFNLKMDSDALSEEGEFTAYAAIFGNVDQGGDVIAPGAFAKSLSEANINDRLIPMLWQHDREEPIGKWLSFEEDKTGLKVHGKLHIDFDPVAKRAYGHLKNGTVGGFSIGYRLVDGGYSVHPDYDDGDGIWLLSELDLREASIVTMPMNLEARLVSVKALVEAGGMPSPREFETLMRDACGFSKKQATDLASLCRPMLRQGEPVAPASEDNIMGLLSGIKQFTGDLAAKS